MIHVLFLQQVVAAALVRGLGLNNDVTIRITGVYLCPNDPLCVGGGRRLGGGRPRRLNNDQTWVNLRFEVVGATSVVLVAKERLRGNVTASTMTNPGPWSPHHISGNM